MYLLKRLEKQTDTWFLIIISFFFVLLRIPSIFEPLWYGDEGVYETIGMALNSGRLLYRDIWDNKPPMLYLLYAFFHANQPVIRLANMTAGLLSIILFFFITKKLFASRNIQYAITSLFALLLAIPLIEGNIANAENFMMPFILAAALLLVNSSHLLKLTTLHKVNFSLFQIRNPYFLTLFIAGFLLGLAFLFKIVAIFDLGAFTLFLLFTRMQKITVQHLKTIFLQVVTLYLGFCIPLACTVVYFALNHALPDFIHSAFLTNIGYVNYGNKFIIPQGLLIIKFLLLIGLCTFLFFKRNQISISSLFIALWFSFSVFNALFSQRPYTHYLLVLVASFCLITGLVLQRRKSQLFLFAIFLLTVIYLGTQFTFFKKNVAYYQNFLAFVSGAKDVQRYRDFFDHNTPRDYVLSDFLLTRLQKDDTIFLWGNNAQLYPLTHTLPPGRYTVAYHVAMNKQSIIETAQAIDRQKPRFIVIMPNAGNFPYRLIQYSQQLTVDQAVIYERNN